MGGDSVSTFPYGESVILHTATAGTPDGYGDDVVTWSDTTVDDCAVWFTSSTETLANQDVVTTTASVLGPFVAIKATDEITVRGLRYAIVGDPDDLRSPLTGTAPGTLVRLRRATG